MRDCSIQMKWIVYSEKLRYILSNSARKYMYIARLQLNEGSLYSLESIIFHNVLLSCKINQYDAISTSEK